MVVKGYAAALSGVEGVVVSVEACAMPFQSEIAMTSVIGLPDHSVKESLYRCESAIMQTSFKPLRQKQIINLSPADLRKEGSGYDLPIAIVMLAMSFQIPETQLKDYIVVGELALDGKIQPIKGVLSMSILAKKQGFKGILVPLQNANEAAMVTDIDVIGVSHLQDAADFLANRKQIKPWSHHSKKTQATHAMSFSEVRGQQAAKRALEIACAGGHNAILIGPPGAGKTLLANSLQSILPPMTLEESLETTQIHSIAGMLKTSQQQDGVITERIIRAPHHSLSHVAMVGGGHPLFPGEISLAHNGVLFLDELPEFQKNTLESLRQPLEEKLIHLSRSRQRVSFPANFMLVASMNPCPCGYYNHPTKTCDCPPGNIARPAPLPTSKMPTTSKNITSPRRFNTETWIETGGSVNTFAANAKHLSSWSINRALPTIPIHCSLYWYRPTQQQHRPLCDRLWHNSLFRQLQIQKRQSPLIQNNQHQFLC